MPNNSAKRELPSASPYPVLSSSTTYFLEPARSRRNDPMTQDSHASQHIYHSLATNTSNVANETTVIFFVPTQLAYA